jgi:hypothetical protein
VCDAYYLFYCLANKFDAILSINLVQHLNIAVSIFAAIVCPNDLPDTTLMAVFNDKCYQFVAAEKYWDDARNYCWEVSKHNMLIEH